MEMSDIEIDINPHIIEVVDWFQMEMSDIKCCP